MTATGEPDRWLGDRIKRQPAAGAIELKATRKPHGAEVAVRMPLSLWATLAPPPR